MIFKKMKKQEAELLYDYESIFTNLMLKLDSLDHANENIQELLTTFLNVIDATGGSLFLYQNEAKLFILKKWIGDKPLNVSISEDYEFVGFLRNTQQVCFKDEMLKESQFKDMRNPAIHYFTQLSCVAVVPLIFKNRWLGLLNIGRSESKLHFNEHDRSLLRILGYWLAHLIANQDLFLKLTHQNKKLEEVTNLKNQLMANVTHELRTPLNGILGLTDLILDGSDGEVNEDQKRHLEMIKGAGENLLEVVNNILSLIKVEATRNNVAIKRLNLTQIIEETSYFFEGVLASKSNRLQKHFSEPLFVYGDEDQVRAILMNLIGNATKFTENGQIDIFASRSGEMVKVCVKDTGIGIDEEEQQRIFDEFRQADGSKTRQFGGTGLGLAIAKKIVDLHGGRIWVDSVKDKGSEFYFTLPSKPAGFQFENENVVASG